ncbi:MAG TPA: IS256 family transposase [Clostridiaceae bacterium]|jgi:transposase-like protein|nr:IS256 family transposase [Clostridiaceae bacterium]
MAQVNLTLTHEEVLQVLTGDRDAAMKFLLERILNEIMKAESEEQLGAGLHERSEERQDYRNGTRERELNTRIGTLTLNVPRHRNEPFHTMVFENYQRSEAALIATMVQMVVMGVSSRKVEKVVTTLCGTSFSKSTVSELCKRLDKDVDQFKNRPLDFHEAPFLMLDATYFKVREDHRIRSKAFLVALAFKPDGKREVVGFDVFDAEENYSWQTFLSGLKERGLTDVRMVISDAHAAIRPAVAKVYPEAAWQRCQVHFLRNILSITPNKYKEALAIELRRMFTASTTEKARKVKEEIVAEYEGVAEQAMKTLEEGFEDSMTVNGLPKYLKEKIRTTNLLERLNRELKRRSDVIQVFPNPASVLRLMGAVTIEVNNTYMAGNRVYGDKTLDELRHTVFPALRRIADDQLKLLNAA